MDKKTVRIGMGQLLVEGGEPGRNLRRAEEVIRQAHREKCNMVLLPECLDLAWTHPSARTKSQSIPGCYSEKLCSIARELQVYICAGLTEKDCNRIYNTAIFIDKNGEILLKYRKINLLVVEQPFYSIGRYLSVIETPFGIIGVNICSDNYLDSLAIGHSLAQMGAQIILSPSSWTVDYSINETQEPYKEKWIKPYSILASLYDLVIIGATSVGYIVGGPYEGKKMVGCSLAVGKGGILAKGRCLELASELVIAEFGVPLREQKGTAIGKMLKTKGYTFDNLKEGYQKGHVFTL